MLWLLRAAAAGYLAALLVVTHWPKLRVGADLRSNLLQFDKLAHIVAFAILTGLLAGAKPLGRRVPWRMTLLLALGLSIALAGLIEQTQPLVAGRMSSWADFVAGVGGSLGVYLVLGAQLVSRICKWPIWLLRGLGLLALPPLVALTFLPVGFYGMQQRGGWLSVIGKHDQAMHFYTAIAVIWLLALICPAGRRRPQLGAALIVLGMGASGLAIEFTQSYTGRGSPSLADLWAHMQGVTVGLLGWAIAATLRIPITVATRKVMPMVALVIGTRARRSDEGDTENALAGHTSLISGLTLVSRLTGLVRDATLAAVFGVSIIADAFFIGFLVPNLFRRLFGEGALSAALIPRYSELLGQDRKLAERLAGVTLAGGAVVLAGLTLVGELGIWLISESSLAAGMGSLALELTLWMLPYMPLVCLIALIGGILQVHRRFGPPAAAPIVLNLFIIAAVLVTSGGYLFGGQPSLRTIARAAAMAVLLGGVVQLLWQVLVLRCAMRPRLGFVGIGGSLRRLVYALVPLLLGLAVFQINAFLDSLMALTLSSDDLTARFSLLGWSVPYPMQTGAVASLQWAQRLYQFPLGVFGIAIATAIFPALSEAASQRNTASSSDVSKIDGAGEGSDPNEEDRLSRILRQGLRLTVFIGLPASVGLLVVAVPLVRTIYERGAFGLEDSQRIATILSGYAAAVWAYSLSHVLTRCFYAVGDERAPVGVGLGMVGLNLCLNLLLIWAPLKEGGASLGAAGLAWSTAICAVGQAVWLLHRVRKHVPKPVDSAVWQSWIRTAAATTVMGVGVGASVVSMNVVALGWWTNAAVLGLAVLLGIGIFFVGAWLGGADELKWLRGR